MRMSGTDLRTPRGRAFPPGNRRRRGALWRRSLGGRFLLLVIAVLVLALVGPASWHYAWDASQVNGELTGKGLRLAAVVARAATAMDAELDPTLDVLLADGEVAYVRVVAGNGRVMDRVAGGGDVSRRRLMPDLVHVRHQFGPGLARVELGLDPRPRLAAAAAEFRGRLLYAGLAMAVIIPLLVLVYYRQVLRPLGLLIAGYRRVARGNLDEPVHIHRRDELGRLAQAFNRMMVRLRRAQRDKDRALAELRELNRHLEARVADRTRRLEELNRDLEHQALHDALTGLPNRTLIQERLQQSVLEAKRHRRNFSVLMMDLDRFKDVNDTLGHDWGDRLLVEVAHRLQALVREADTVGRLGGDEFLIILPEADTEGAVQVARKVLEALEPAFNLEGMQLAVSASIGIASFPEHGFSPSTLLKSADVAMYGAKHAREGWRVYQFDSDRNDRDRLGLMSELREAIRRDALQLVYQPKVSLEGDAVVGLEALVRWPHPRRGMIPPDEFIGLAEQTGVVRPLTAWVLETVGLQIHQWRGLGVDTSVAVNLSVYNLQDAGLIEHVGQVLEAYDLHPGQLTLEITESAIMQDPKQARDVLVRLEAMGVRLSIDDFGTGYSSLSYLKRLPVDELKIDRSFVMDMSSNRDDAAIVHSIINLAHNLGVEVIAEGVEDAAVMNLLLMLGCDYVQGYHVSRPLPPGAVPAFMQAVASGSADYLLARASA